MRIRKAEWAVIIIAVAFVCFAGGFFVGRLGAPGAVTPVGPPPADDTPGMEDASDTALPATSGAPAATGGSDEPPDSPAAETGAPASDSEHDAQGRVNINTASAQTLQELRGIGPSISARIVEYRDEHGPFTAVDELLNVTGIGNAKFADIKDHVTVG
jgi:competence ComEA-like helix-hairpin-helix protein